MNKIEMNSLKVGDVFAFAFYPNFDLVHKRPVQCIVLKLNVECEWREELFTCTYCPTCKSTVGICLWSRRSTIFHQILVGNKKIKIGDNGTYKALPPGCPENKQNG